jgi:hypothetical protein
MSDIVDSLNRIANILESSSEQGFLQTMGVQFLFLFAGAAVGVIGTYLLSRKLQQELLKKNKKEEEEKRAEGRKLLYNLLDYEITQRWQNEIGKHFKKHLKKFNDENLDKISNTTFRTHDLYIIKKCAEDVFAANLFDDKNVISYIVRVHGYSIDLVDAKEGLQERFTDYQEAIRALESAPGFPKDLVDAKEGLQERFTKYQEAIRALESAHDDNADIESLKRKCGDAKEHLDRLDYIWKFLKNVYEEIDYNMEKILKGIKPYVSKDS